MRRNLAALVVVGLLAGCSSGTASEGTAGGADSDTAVKFAECMRTSGVPDFPDPDASGEFDYNPTVSGEAWTKALDACKDLRPAGSFSADRNPEQQAAALKFAQCIRTNGVPDFPDPVNGEPLVDTNKIPSSNREGGMTILNAAMKKCAGVGAGALTGTP